MDKDEIRTTLDNMHLVGRVISNISFRGIAYNFSADLIEHRTYERAVVIDESLLISFEDGDQFEIDTPQEPIFCISMTPISEDIEHRSSHQNVNTELFFSPCVGKRVKSTEVETYVANKDPMYGHSYPEGERELVSGIILWLDGNMGLKVKPNIDYCDVSMVDAEGNPLEIKFSELSIKGQ